MFEFDPFSWEIQDDPYPAYKLLRDQYPAYFVKERGFWVISRYDDVYAAAMDSASWSSARGGNLIDDSPARIGRTLGTTDPPRHEELRRLVSKAFTPVRVAQLEPLIRRTTLELIGTFLADRRCDFTGQFAGQLTASVIGYLLGVPAQDHAQLRVWTDAFVHREAGPEAANNGMEAFGKLQAYVDAMVKSRRSEPQDDLVSALIAAEEAGAQLNDEGIVITSATMIAAAFESTNLMLGNALVALYRNPAVRSRVREQPSLIAAMIEEALRWDTSTHGFARQTTRDVEIGGTVIPADSRAMIMFAAANRDERKYTDPDRFDLERTGPRHLGFGMGIHYCIGAPLARLEMQVAFEELLPRLGDYEVDLAQAERAHSPTFRGYQVLPVAF